MIEYLAHFFTEDGKYIRSKNFLSQTILKSYLKEHGASYDVHKLSNLGDDLLTINKIDINGAGYIEIEELATPKKTDSITVDGVSYITQDGAMRKYGLTLRQVKYTVKTKGLNKFSAGAMNRLFVEDKFV